MLFKSNVAHGSHLGGEVLHQGGTRRHELVDVRRFGVTSLLRRVVAEQLVVPSLAGRVPVPIGALWPRSPRATHRGASWPYLRSAFGRDKTNKSWVHCSVLTEDKLQRRLFAFYWRNFAPQSLPGFPLAHSFTFGQRFSKPDQTIEKYGASGHENCENLVESDQELSCSSTTRMWPFIRETEWISTLACRKDLNFDLCLASRASYNLAPKKIYT